MRSRWTTAVSATLLLALAASHATARTWRVELNGSGNFTDIQPAVNAAAAGDTILIGPGRFATFHPAVAPAWTEQTIVWVTKDNLTFIGSGQGSTILGPTTYYGPYGKDPKGFCSFGEFRGTIKDLTIENIENGVYWWSGSIVVDGCTVKGENNPSFVGMLLWPLGATIRNCTIDTHFAGVACVIGGGARDVNFEDCSFPGYGRGVGCMDGSQNTRFARCTFVHSYDGVIFDSQSQGTMSDCSFDGIQANALTVMNGAQLHMSLVRINGAATGIVVASGASVTGTNVILQGTQGDGLLACCNAFVTLTESHFLPAQGYAVRCSSTWANASTLNLTGNYWGTVDALAISNSIWDAVDQPSINCTAQFMPYADGPVPTESTTWGGLKALWR
jgi:hypothetical protein